MTIDPSDLTITNKVSEFDWWVDRMIQNGPSRLGDATRTVVDLFRTFRDFLKDQGYEHPTAEQVARLVELSLKERQARVQGDEREQLRLDALEAEHLAQRRR